MVFFSFGSLQWCLPVKRFHVAVKAPSIPTLTGFSQDYKEELFLVRSMKIFLLGVRSSNDHTGHIIPTQNYPKPSLLPGRALGPFLILIAVSFHQSMQGPVSLPIGPAHHAKV